MKHSLIIFLLFSSQVVFAKDGQTLHDAHCIECHSRMTGGDGHVVYTRDDRIAKSLDELHARVIHCSNGSNTGWGEQQIKAVTHYLNQKYYQY